jgi:hypothetical protein
MVGVTSGTERLQAASSTTSRMMSAARNIYISQRSIFMPCA